MSECWLYYDNRDYLAKNLTSHARIILNINKHLMSGIECSWCKEFSFGGDKLIIEEKFFVKRKLSFFKRNPIYDMIIKGWKFSEYKKIYGENKGWMDYILYVAKTTDSEEELHKVINKTQEVVDLLNKWSNEGRI